MAEALQNLGQQKPPAGILTDLTTAPAATQMVISTIVICNQGPSQDFYRISQAVAGAADTLAQYIAYDIPISGNTSDAWTVGVTLAPTDKLRCQSRNGTTSFNVQGTAVT